MMGGSKSGSVPLTNGSGKGPLALGELFCKPSENLYRTFLKGEKVYSDRPELFFRSSFQEPEPGLQDPDLFLLFRLAELLIPAASSTK
jgi:hypothetical protein